MRISGYEPLTLLDYPGKLAAIVFTPGCVLRCPFCHNPELIQAQTKDSPYFRHNREDEFFDFLTKRQGKLDGVVITGGEPTLHKDLIDFISRVKSMGFLVKFDTNGVFPDRVAEIMKTGLVDYWAMDIKHAPEKYAIACGLPAGALAKEGKCSLEQFQQSVQLIMKSGKPYEFRTTVVPGIHEEQDFEAIGEWIAGASAYALQAFRDMKIYDPELAQKAKASKPLDLKRIQKTMQKYVHRVEIRE